MDMNNIAMAQQQRNFEEPPASYFEEVEDRKYNIYLEDFKQDLSDAWEDFKVDVQEGHTDPMTYDEWLAEQERPATHEEWCMDMADAAEERALMERYPEGW